MGNNRYILMAIWFGLLASVARAQNYTWDTFVGTSLGNDDSARDIRVNSSGDIFSVFTQYDGVNNDAMLVKYNSSGTIQWTKRYERTFMDTLASQNEEYITVLPSGTNVFALGYQYNGSFNEVILHKYDSSGTSVWSVAFNDGNACNPARGLVEDASGNLYVLFNRSGSSNNIRIAKFNSSGTHQWTKSFAYSGKSANTFHFDNASSALIANLSGGTGSNISKFNLSGTRSWTTNFAEVLSRKVLVDGSSNLYTQGTNSTNDAIVMRKFNSSGVQQWSYTTPTITGYLEATDLCIDSSGNLYGVGFFQFNLAFTSVFYSLTSAGASRFYQQDSTLPLQAYYNIGVGAGGSLYISGYMNPVSSGNVKSKIDKFDTAGMFLERREVSLASLTMSYGWVMDFDSSGAAVISGPCVSSSDQKVYIAKY